MRNAIYQALLFRQHNVLICHSSHISVLDSSSSQATAFIHGHQQSFSIFTILWRHYSRRLPSPPHPHPSKAIKMTAHLTKTWKPFHILMDKFYFQFPPVIYEILFKSNKMIRKFLLRQRIITHVVCGERSTRGLIVVLCWQARHSTAHFDANELVRFPGTK